MSNTIVNTQVKLKSLPSQNYPKDNSEVFEVTSSQIPSKNQVPSNSVLVKVLALSIDAANRVWISGYKSYRDPVKIGSVMSGGGVGQIIYSNSSKFKTGDKVFGDLGWQQYSVVSASTLMQVPSFIKNIDDMLSLYGSSGLTAHIGLFKIGKIKKGQTVVISAAAGGVGQLAVQIAKNFGCNVIGIAGSDDKCKYVCQIGADHCINYQKQNVQNELKRLCPKGLDVYFDNVGGQILDAVLMNIKDSSRIILCGSVSTYYGRDQPYKLKNYPRLIIKRCVMQGFIVMDHVQDFPQIIKQLAQMQAQNKIKIRYDYSYGVKQCPNALKKLLTGGNKGKVVVKVDVQQPKL